MRNYALDLRCNLNPRGRAIGDEPYLKLKVRPVHAVIAVSERRNIMGIRGRRLPAACNNTVLQVLGSNCITVYLQHRADRSIRPVCIGLEGL